MNYSDHKRVDEIEGNVVGLWLTLVTFILIFGGAFGWQAKTINHLREEVQDVKVDLYKLGVEVRE